MTPRTIAFILCGYLLGFLEAVPVGATQVEIARRSVRGFRFSSLMIIAGSVLSDAMYGAVAFFGFAPFLQSTTVRDILWPAGAVILLLLGIWTLRTSGRDADPQPSTQKILASGDVAFVTGFSLALTNPFMITWWLIGAHVLTSVDLMPVTGSARYVVLLIAGSLGIGSYLALLSFIISRSRTFFSETAIRRISFASAIFLFALAGYFAVRFVSLLS